MPLGRRPVDSNAITKTYALWSIIPYVKLDLSMTTSVYGLPEILCSFSSVASSFLILRLLLNLQILALVVM